MYWLLNMLCFGVQRIYQVSYSLYVCLIVVYLLQFCVAFPHFDSHFCLHACRFLSKKILTWHVWHWRHTGHVHCLTCFLPDDIFHFSGDFVGRQKGTDKISAKNCSCVSETSFSSHTTCDSSPGAKAFKITKGFRFRPLSLHCYHSTKAEKWSRNF